MRNPFHLALAALVMPVALAAQLPVRATGFQSWLPPAPAYSAAAAAMASSSAESGEPHSVQWYEAAAVAGAIVASSALDDAVRDYTQAHRTETKDDIAKVFRHMGQPEVYATVGLGTIAAGLIGGDDDVTRAGGRITASLITAGATNSLLKYLVGRKRPNSATDPFEFDPFSNNVAFPSGHTAMAFALATSLSDEINSLPVTIGLFSASTLTGWSRINDNKHWLSDVVGGAVVGFTSAKVMEGDWEIFGLGQPHFLASPDGASVSMTIAF